MSKAPYADIAQKLQKFGRHGDEVLVHLNPIEVDMLKSLSPTGELTTNPDTGLQEAFLPLLAGLIPGLFPGLAASLGLGSGIMGAAGLGAGLGGIASALEGKNVLKGALMGGLSGGAGKALGGIGDKFSKNMEILGAPASADNPAGVINAVAPKASGGGVMGWLGKHPMLAAGGLAAMSGMGGRGGYKPSDKEHEYVPEAYFTNQPRGINIGQPAWDNYGSTREYDLIQDDDPGMASISYR
jgi:hypothetical protein